MTTIGLNRRDALVGLLATPAILLSRKARAESNINVAVLRLGSQAPTFIAYERGYFAKEGLNVTLKYFEAAQPAAVAIASGDVDYSATALSGGLISLAEKGAVKVFGGALTEQKGVVGSVILASNKAFAAGLTTPGQLAGKSFGITTTGSSFHYMAHKIAQTNNIADRDIKLRPLQKLGALVGALSSSQIDAWAIQDNIAQRLVSEGVAHRIGLVSDYVPDYQVTVVFGSTKDVANDRAKTSAYLRAYTRAVDDYNAAFVDKTMSRDDTVAMVKLVHKYVDPETSFDEAFTAFTQGSLRINSGAALSMKSCLDQLDWFKAEAMVKPNITPEMLFDTSYVKTV
jgi:NitT/TauT family transport system substrate-binding protein